MTNTLEARLATDALEAEVAMRECRWQHTKTLRHEDGSVTLIEVEEYVESWMSPRDCDGNLARLVVERDNYIDLDDPDSGIEEARDRWGDGAAYAHIEYNGRRPASGDVAASAGGVPSVLHREGGERRVWMRGDRMSLRRVGLQRKTELRRTPMKRKTALKVRSVKAARPRDTGPSPATRALVLSRAGGCCELCGTLLHDGFQWTAERSVHHRQARGMGGSSLASTNSPSNLMLLCGSGTTGCHGFITRHPAAAEQEGWIVRHGLAPAEVLVTVHAGSRHRFDSINGGTVRTSLPSGIQIESRQVLLTDQGTYQEAA